MRDDTQKWRGDAFRWTKKEYIQPGMGQGKPVIGASSRKFLLQFPQADFLVCWRHDYEARLGRNLDPVLIFLTTVKYPRQASYKGRGFILGSQFWRFVAQNCGKAHRFSCRASVQEVPCGDTGSRVREARSNLAFQQALVPESPSEDTSQGTQGPLTRPAS